MHVAYIKYFFSIFDFCAVCISVNFCIITLYLCLLLSIFMFIFLFLFLFLFSSVFIILFYEFESQCSLFCFFLIMYCNY